MLQKQTCLYPAIFPLLLYNGQAKWSAKLNVSELIEESISSKYIPSFKYYPILINEIDTIFYARMMNCSKYNPSNILELNNVNLSPKEQQEKIPFSTSFCVGISMLLLILTK